MGCRLFIGRYVLRVLCGENRPKSENWATLKPRSSATVRRTEKLTDMANSLALGLQRGINNISLQCISWPIACSDWGICLTPQSLGFWRQTTPEWKLFINFCPNSAFFTHDSRVIPSISPPLSRSRRKFGERCRPLTWACVLTLVRIGCVLPDLLRKESRKVNTIIIGFQPTIIIICYRPSDRVQMDRQDIFN